MAVKVLGDNHATDPDIRARFISEGRCLRRLDSPHVVRVYDLGETDQGQPYVVAASGAGCLMGVGLVLGIQYLSPGDRPAVEDLGDGTVEVTVEAGDARVAIIGPETVEAGEVATFEAAVEGCREMGLVHARRPGGTGRSRGVTAGRRARPGPCHPGRRHGHR